jgi:hypothetical protein
MQGKSPIPTLFPAPKLRLDSTLALITLIGVPLALFETTPSATPHHTKQLLNLTMKFKLQDAQKIGSPLARSGKRQCIVDEPCQTETVGLI